MKEKSQNKKGLKSLSKKQRTRILIVVGAVVLLLAACYTVFIAPLLEKEQWIYKEELVERGTLKVGVTESGSLEYGIQSVMYELDLDVSNDEEEEEESEEETVQRYLKIEEMYVSAGQRVKAGDALFKLTDNSVADVRQLLASALVDASTEYSEAEAEYRLSSLEAETNYESAVTQAEYAEDIYKRSVKTVGNEIAVMQIELQQCVNKISSLEAALVEAQEEYNEIAYEFEEAKASKAQIDIGHTESFLDLQSGYLNQETQYENAKKALKQAQQNMSDNADEIDSLQRKIADAQARKNIDEIEVEAAYQETIISGEIAQITYDAEIEALKETLQESAEEKSKLQKQKDAFEAFVGEDGILYATEEGIVTEVSYKEGDRLINTGLILAYATPDNMTITVDVTQEDIVDLQVGDKVDITFSAYEKDTYTGMIQSINTTATAANSNTVSYTVVILVEGDTSLLYGGMSADVIFVTEQKEDVLFISRKAIVEENGKTYVYRETAMGGKELTEVETGITNGIDIEIISGLEEGDTIYLASRVSSEVEVRESEGSEGASGTDGEFTMPEGMELPEGMEFDMEQMPGDFGNGGGMPNFGGRNNGGNSGNGGGMPNFGGGNGGNAGGGMPGGR